MKNDSGLDKAALALGRTPTHLDRSSVRGLDYPTFRLSLIAKVMDRMTLRYFAEFGDITVAEWRVLCRICGDGDMTVGKIAELALVDRAEVSRAASSLEKRGLIGRRENPHDRRTPILYATAAGNQAHKPLLDSRRRFHENLLEDLSPLERELLDALLKKLTDRLNEMGPETPPT